MQLRKTFALASILIIVSSMFPSLLMFGASVESMHTYAWTPLYPESTNLAPMPYGWKQWGEGGPKEDPKFFFIDYNVLSPSGNPSIRLGPDLGYPTRGSVRDAFPLEPWMAVKPGDHIVFSCWMKTEPGPTDPNSGARMGIDFYDNNGWIGGTSCPDGDPSNPHEKTVANHVQWNTPTWSFRKIEFSISTVNGKMPTGIYPWIMVMPCDYTNDAWFADCELYINPLGSQDAPASDAIINTLDMLIIAVAFGTEPGDPKWNPDADLNEDGSIDILDILRWATSASAQIDARVSAQIDARVR